MNPDPNTPKCPKHKLKTPSSSAPCKTCEKEFVSAVYGARAFDPKTLYTVQDVGGFVWNGIFGVVCTQHKECLASPAHARTCFVAYARADAIRKGVALPAPITCAHCQDPFCLGCKASVVHEGLRWDPHEINHPYACGRHDDCMRDNALAKACFENAGGLKAYKRIGGSP